MKLNLIALSACILVMTLSAGAYAQQPENSSRRTIGSDVSDLVLHHVSNNLNSTDTLRLGEIRGKAILIDFWAIFCTPCIAQLPKLQLLQNKYREQLTIITATTDSKAKVNELFQKLKYLNLNLVASTSIGENGNKLNVAFPHRYIPHYVWISKDHRVLAITGHDQVNDRNITDLIAGKITLQVKEDEITAPVKSVQADPIFSSDSLDLVFKFMIPFIGDDKLTYHSMFSKYDQRYTPSYAFDVIGPYKDRRVRFMNITVGKMATMAYGRVDADANQVIGWTIPRVVYDFTDTALLRKVTAPSKDYASELFNYDLIVPKPGLENLMKKVQQELKFYTGVTGQIVLEERECFVLKMIDEKMANLQKGLKPIFDANALYLKMVDSPISKLVKRLRSYNEGSKSSAYSGYSSGIIVDETNYKGNISVDLTCKLNDLEEVNRQLAAYGLQLTRGKRTIEILKLTDK